MSLKFRDTYILKRPFGTLVIEKDITKQKILSMLQGAKKLIAVGDATTRRLISFGITPDISVIDGIERRSRHNLSIQYPAKEMFCKNPAGTVSIEAMHVLQDALHVTMRPVVVRVHGEEDLLALPLFIMAPEGSVVLYGQPLKGMVIVKITEEKKGQARDLLYRICANPDDLQKATEQSKGAEC